MQDEQIKIVGRSEFEHEVDRTFVTLLIMDKRISFLCLLLVTVDAKPVSNDGKDIFRRQKENQWFKDGHSFIENSLKTQKINKRAKNVILFVGDGMGVSTVTAARVLDGQLKGGTGEENILSWEKFPFLGLSKTYNTDAQTPDSAGTATALMTGVKARSGVVSVNENTVRGNCTASKRNEVLSILQIAEIKGLATGVVSTARITHATPSTTYAHASDRNWEYEAAGDCKDIASQLVSFPYGDGIEVALGGGRRSFLPASEVDPEYPHQHGKRKDNRDLTKEWTAKSKSGDKWEYIWNKGQFDGIDTRNVDHILGLFEYSHMKYSTENKNDTAGEPTLTEMTEFAIKALQEKNKGYFLLVEGGRIDHGHHDNMGYHALHDAVEMSRAVAKADQLTKPEDTLIIVTADHSHVFVFGGYQKRGNPIFGLAEKYGLAKDGKPYTSIGYYNGPSAKINKTRDIPKDYMKETYMQQSLIPLTLETHGAEDVGIYGRGPQAHLLQGVIEQSNIFHLMDYALCLSEDKEKLCIQQGLIKSSSSPNIEIKLSVTILLAFISYILKIA